MTATGGEPSAAAGPVVIVGAGLGGSRVARNLRARGHAGEVILLGRESHPPYDRPPLSKAVLAGQKDRVDLEPQEFFVDNDIDLRTGWEATSVNVAARTLTVRSTEDGAEDTLSYRALVLAPGLVPRTLPFGRGLAGVHVLRTIEDALALRAEAESFRAGTEAGRGGTAVVVGAGFIGCEVAASLRALGTAVTVIEAGEAPLAAALGETVGHMVGRLHIERGVDIRTAVGVASFTGTDRVTGVVLSDGTELAADFVVLGVGSTPAIEWLSDSTVATADPSDGGGIACDHRGRTTAAGVYALGDAANWIGREGRHGRVEHWNSVVAQADTVTSAILGEPDSGVKVDVPYFWSDQYGVKIQALGHPRPDDDVHVIEDDGRKFLVYYSRNGVLTGVVGAGRGGAVMTMRPKLTVSTTLESLLV